MGICWRLARSERCMVQNNQAQDGRTAPPDQDKLVEGTKNAILELIKSEPYGDGPVVPEYLKWE